MRFRLALLISFITSCVVYAQEFKAEAKLQPVEADGFYRVDLSPALSAFSNERFSNIRIYNQQHEEVPYLFQQETLQYYSTQFKKYEIVDKAQIKNCCTHLVLKNPDNFPINNISLSIKNAEVSKQATLLGSDDQKNWFALKQYFTLEAIYNSDNTSTIKIVDFPLSNYTFYKLEINDSSNAPLNILSAGYFEQQTEEGKHTIIPNVKIERTDSAQRKQTFIKIHLDTVMAVDRIEIAITGQPYFLRRASLHSLQFGKNRRGEQDNFLQHQYDFELSSKQNTILNLSDVRSNQLLIIINNEDNQPLQVASIKLMQRNRYLVAWLKTNEEYFLKIGDANMPTPNYDLINFQENIPQQLTRVGLSQLSIFTKQQNQTTTTIFTSKIVIWLAIVLVVILLGFMSVKLIKETNVPKAD